MAIGEQALEQQVQPADLQAAMNHLLSTRGEQLPTGGIRVEFLSYGPVGIDPEECPYDSLISYRGKDGYPVYVYNEVTPGAGYKEEQLAFLGDEVAFRGHMELFGQESVMPHDNTPVLSDEEITELYLRITDPEIETRHEMIERYYRQRHEQRSRIGRALARVLGTDNPKRYMT